MMKFTKGSDDMPIDEKDDFLVVVPKPVLCDDGNKVVHISFMPNKINF